MSGKAIAEVIRCLYHDLETRERLAETGYFFAHERFSKALMLERMEAIFTKYGRNG
jgi:hypothetical protein